MITDKKSILSVMFVLVFVFLFGCSGNKDTTEPTTPSISFTPSGTPSDNTVFLEQVSTNNNEITLAVKVKGGSDVYAHATEINFDGNKVQYLSGSAGGYLTQDGKTTSGFNDNKSYIGTSGVLTLGDSRQGNVLGVAGDGILCQIILKALTIQTDTVISFNSTNSFLKSSDSTNQNISGTIWLGGSLSYQ